MRASLPPIVLCRRSPCRRIHGRLGVVEARRDPRLELDRAAQALDEPEDLPFLGLLGTPIKQAAGDVAGDSDLRRQGKQEQRKGEAKEELARDQERADPKAEEVANLERKTS